MSQELKSLNYLYHDTVPGIVSNLYHFFQFSEICNALGLMILYVSCQTHTDTQQPGPETAGNFGTSHVFVTWLKKLFFCICAVERIKILLFLEVETFILPQIVKNQLKNRRLLYNLSEQTQQEEGRVG